MLAAIQLAAFSDRFLINLVAQPLATSLRLSDTQLGIALGSAFVVTNALASLMVGRHIDGGWARSMLIVSVTLWTGATIACGLAVDFAQLLAFRLLLGLGQAGITPAAISIISHRLPRDRLGRAVSLLTGGASLGRSLALLGGGSLLGWLSTRQVVLGVTFHPESAWRAVFILGGLVNVVLLAALLLLGPSTRGPAARPGTLRAASWLNRRRGAYAGIAVPATCAMLVNQGLSAWATIFYGRAHALPPASAGIVLGTIILFAAPAGHLLGGRLLDRLGRTVDSAPRRRLAPRLLGCCLLLVLPAAGLMSFGPGRIESLVGFGALVLLIGVTSPVALTGVQWLTPVALRGRITALFVAGITLVSIGLGPLLIGLLNDRVFGAAGVGSTMLAVFAAVAIVGVAAAALAELPIGRRRPRPRW